MPTKMLLKDYIFYSLGFSKRYILIYGIAPIDAVRKKEIGFLRKQDSGFSFGFWILLFTATLPNRSGSCPALPTLILTSRKIHLFFLLRVW